MSVAPRDQNYIPSLLAVLNTDSVQGTNLVPVGIMNGLIQVSTTDTISFTMEPIAPRDENYVSCWLFEGTDGQTYPAVANSDGHLLINAI